MATRGRELTEELGKLIPLVRRLVWNAASHRLERLEMSMFAWQLVSRVVRHGGLNQLELARLTAQHPAAVCRVLEDLEGKGLVRRRRDARDRRRVLVEATADGERLYSRTRPEVIRAVDEALEPLTGRERTTLRDLLRKLVAGEEGEPVAP